MHFTEAEDCVIQKDSEELAQDTLSESDFANQVLAALGTWEGENCSSNHGSKTKKHKNDGGKINPVVHISS